MTIFSGKVKPPAMRGLNGRHEETRTPDLYRVNRAKSSIFKVLQA